MAASYSLGIDIGGTFTDIVLHGDDGAGRHAGKVLTTHDDPARGVVAGIAGLLERHAIDPGSIRRVVHATTLFTNALIERKGAPTGLVTTAGFRDVLEIGRERKFELYDLNIQNPQPLVPRNLRREIAERVSDRGAVLRAVDETELTTQVAALQEAGVTSVAVVFIHAYANSANERAAAATIAERFPRLQVSASHEVASEIREFERTSTTAANAYIKPLASGYLDEMAGRLRALGVEAPLLLMLSNGGFTHVAEAKRNPVQLLESGPAAGALAAAHFGTEQRNLLAFDMGGTTAKLSLIDDGVPLVAYGFEAARQKRFIEGSGLPIRISAIELIEIGAGGGSLAHADEIGLLKVGPESAGSEPGPACYGRGGAEPTVTDANLLLGYLNPAYFAGGTLPIDMERARAAIGRLSGRLLLRPVQTAWGIHDVVNENMAGAARVHIAERGRDPRGYSLLTTGGGGPVHGYQVAKKLGLRQMICPPAAGVASAIGLLAAPAKIDRVATVGMRLEDGSLDVLEAAFCRLEAEARAVIAATGVGLAAVRVERFADGRFAGQGFYLVTELPAGPYAPGDATAMRAALHAAFERAYREKFARTPPAVAVEFVNVRVAVYADIPGIAPDRSAQRARQREPIKGRRPVYFAEAGDFVDTTVYDRAALEPDFEFMGPAVVEEEGSTLVVAPGGRARIAASGNILVTIG